MISVLDLPRYDVVSGKYDGMAEYTAMSNHASTEVAECERIARNLEDATGRWMNSGRMPIGP